VNNVVCAFIKLLVSLDSIAYSISSQTALALSPGWANYAAGYGDASYAVENGDTVFLAGLIKNATWTYGKAFLTVPDAPEYMEAFPANSNNGYGRVDVLSNGQAILRLAVGTSGWISLDNIHYRKSGAVFSNAVMASAWVTYTGYAPASSSLTNGIVVVRGLVKSGTATTIATIPVAHAPVARRIFVAVCATGACRVDILPTGAVVLVGKTYGVTGWPSWVSLSGIIYKPTPDTTSGKRGLDSSVTEEEAANMAQDFDHEAPQLVL